MEAVAVRACRRRPDDFEHDALLYAGDGEFLAGTLSFLREGIEAGEPALTVLAPPRLALLRDALGSDADEVQFADMLEVGSNPGLIISAWQAFVAARDDSRPVRGIGEPIWPGRRGAELSECHRNESLLNVAFAGTSGFRLLCPYDTDALAPEVLEEARRNHPFLQTRDGRVPSGEYSGLEAHAATPAEPLPEPATDPVEICFDDRSLAGLRSCVRRCALEAGLDEERSQDLVLAASEVASNSLVHGAGRGTLRIWQDDGYVVCEVEDAGRNDQPLAGRVRPDASALSGRGLWIANQLCELVQIRSTPRGGIVRLHVRRH